MGLLNITPVLPNKCRFARISKLEGGVITYDF